MKVYIIQNNANQTYDEVRCEHFLIDGDVIQLSDKDGNITLIYKLLPGDFITYSHEE